ncbi:MAG: polysaccharide deacetylase family protein [Saprospiraceae bacterium]|nr:polysaccharide deacetylase family protein [Saprospiraceae bacterium]MCB9319476.1 polysaccharide deacetylase family protein [Lewinellaceae bacterium]
MMYRLLKFMRRSFATQFYQKYQTIDLKAPIVSFTFDDSYGCTFDHAGDLLWQREFHGTFYVSFKFLGLKSQPNFQLAQLKRIVNQGHEIGCHTYGHIDLSQISRAKAIQDIEYNQHRLSQLFPGMKFQNFSFPFGSETYPLKKFVGKQFLSARGNRPGLNFGNVDMANLKSIKLYEQKYSIKDIEHKLDMALHHNAWIIFHTHDVQKEYTQYGCSPEYFDQVLKSCEIRSMAVRSIDEAQTLLYKPIQKLHFAQVGS